MITAIRIIFTSGLKLSLGYCINKYYIKLRGHWEVKQSIIIRETSSASQLLQLLFHTGKVGVDV